jgi:hypothetical protein
MTIENDFNHNFINDFFFLCVIKYNTTLVSPIRAIAITLVIPQYLLEFYRLLNIYEFLYIKLIDSIIFMGKSLVVLYDFIICRL